MASARPGFFGKLPSRGDYVGQDLPPAFIDPFEAWLHRALAASQSVLAARWQELFRASPVWRFVLGSGLCGEAAAAGVMLPSADRAGRSYPFIIAASLAARPAPIDVVVKASAWFERARQFGRAMIERPMEPGMITRGLAQLGAPEFADAPRPPPLAARPAGWRVASTLPQDPLASIAPLLHGVASTICLGYSLWWTEGSAAVKPSMLLCDGLPAPERFAAFIDGRWAERGWPGTP